MNTKLYVDYYYLFEEDEKAMSELIDTEEWDEDEFNSKPNYCVYKEEDDILGLITFLEYKFQKIAIDVEGESFIYVSEDFDINTTYKPSGGEEENIINAFNVCNRGKEVRTIPQEELDEMFYTCNEKTY